MKPIITAVLVLLTAAVFAQNGVRVFTSGLENYGVFRIPAIIKAPNGDLLAFCEGRVHNGEDFGNIDIVMKRSTDGGNTWGALQKVTDNDTLQAGNPAPVVDLTDRAHPGRIFLFYNTGTKREDDVRHGRGVREVWYKTSTDNGKTWSEPVNITTQVHRPNAPEVNPAYKFSEDWRWYANGPGHAMQFQSGKYRGRIFVPANHSTGAPQPQNVDLVANGFYTDDHGKTFHIGGNIKISGSNESMAAELSGSKLMMTSRNQKGDVKARIISISSSGGARWDNSYYDTTLTDPMCEGSILNVGKLNGKNIIAHANPANASTRDNLSLRISTNNGKKWSKVFTVENSGSNKPNAAAYSDMAKLSVRRIGILYERNGYREIVFSAVKWK